MGFKSRLKARKKEVMKVALFFIFMFTALGFSVWSYQLIYKPPSNFPINKIITIEEGYTLRQISSELYKAGVIRSEFLFSTLVIYIGGEKSIMHGELYFDSPAGMYDVATRLTRGELGMMIERVTIPEGFTVKQIATLLDKRFRNITESKFVELAGPKEGYLFPDTYFFRSLVTADEVIATMERNFNLRLDEIQSEIADFGLPLKDIIIMASMIEGEAREETSRRMVSGILWKRIEIGMPLQVDAVFPYIIGKNTYELTTDDLNIDSPYNTYKYTGLPYGPINNPGLDSIKAAINPTQSEYLYYLTDLAGRMYYARTFEEHIANRRFMFLD
jgi:UPF0755 protein